MKQLVASSKSVAELVGTISEANSQQAVGIALINHAVAGLERTTQQNASLVEQAASASMSLKLQSQDLKAVMSQFKLEPELYEPVRLPSSERRGMLSGTGS
jgi:methyl-accepting chemotaxis protein